MLVLQLQQSCKVNRKLQDDSFVRWKHPVLSIFFSQHAHIAQNGDSESRKSAKVDYRLLGFGGGLGLGVLKQQSVYVRQVLTGVALRSLPRGVICAAAHVHDRVVFSDNHFSEVCLGEEKCQQTAGATGGFMCADGRVASHKGDGLTCRKGNCGLAGGCSRRRTKRRTEGGRLGGCRSRGWVAVR